MYKFPECNMNKSAKIIITSAVLVLLMCTSALADGWTQDSKGWRYLKGGLPVYDEWAADAAGDFFYIGPDGYMTVSQFVDDNRYVDSTGRMVKSDWRQIDGVWYYFDINGRMIQGKKKVINGQTYIFDDDGAMITGWYMDGTDWYYCDPVNGSLVKETWKKLEPAEDMPEISDFMAESESWFYFTSSGKIYKAGDSDGEYREYKIGDSRYAFDNCGRMQTGWVKLEDKDPAIAGYKYYNDSEALGVYGAAHTGWLSAYVPEEIDASDDVEWYYFDSRGVPCYGERDGLALIVNLKKITKNGTTYSYLFNEKGNPVYGLQRVKTPDGTETSMYFGTKSQSCLQKATQVIEGDGSSYKYGFTNAGYGINGPSNGYLYYKGKAQRATDDLRAYFTVGGETYLVNSNGYLIKNFNKNKDPKEVEYRSDSTGRRDGGTAGVTPVDEPYYQED